MEVEEYVFVKFAFNILYNLYVSDLLSQIGLYNHAISFLRYSSFALLMSALV